MSEFAWLGVLRHGQSEGNVAADRAEASGAEAVDILIPDPRVDLTATGRAQARAVGSWLASAEDRPDVIVTSPYVRARHTADIVAGVLGLQVRVDERLRDRELGILDRLTRTGVAARYPEEDARRAYLGKFYYRPPGGESWADVAQRLRMILGDLRQTYADQRVLLVAHEAIVFLCRYAIDQLDIDEVERLARRALATAGLTAWTNVGGELTLMTFDETAPRDL